MNEVLIKIYKLLDNKIKWAVFGSVAVAIHNGSLYRDFEDIDIITENNDEKLKKLMPDLKNCDRSGRKKRCIKIDNIPVEFMLMTGQNEIDLADSKFKFYNIEEIEFSNTKVPVIDLQSLYCAKLRHKRSLENELEKYKIKLENCNQDIQVIEELLKNIRK